MWSPLCQSSLSVHSVYLVDKGNWIEEGQLSWCGKPYEAYFKMNNDPQ